MATVFEVALWGRDELYLRTTAEEAMVEIRRLEQQLSLYRDDSDVYDLNHNAWKHPMPVDPRLFALLCQAKELSEYCGGTFDITVGPLIRAWGFMGASGAAPDPNAVRAAKGLTGMDLIQLDEENHTVQYLREGVMIDLGAIGKGYAIEQVTELIRDREIPGGLVHGGTSTVTAIGTQPDGTPWPVALQDPTEAGRHLTVLQMEDISLSISAVHGKYFEEGDARYGHVLDPRTGAPTQSALLAAVVCPSATETDALSTGLLVAGESLMEKLCARLRTGALLVVREDSDEPTMVTCSLPEALETAPLAQA